MNAALQTQSQATKPSFAPVPGGFLHRECARGSSSGLSETDEFGEQRISLQPSTRNPEFETRNLGGVPPLVSEVLLSPDQPLDADRRAFRERRLGHNFSRVRVDPTSRGVVQTKLTVSQPGDSFEQEADRVAQQVMRSPQSGAAGLTAMVGTLPTISRGATHVSQASRESDEQDPDETTEDELDDPSMLSLKAFGSSPPPPVGVTAQIESMRGGGQPLTPDLRNFFEPRFGHDFSRVRVHTDDRAAQTAQALNARAYTLGQDIAIAPNEYRPDTWVGRLLLAHELTHVVQQADQVQTVMRACMCPFGGMPTPETTKAYQIQHPRLKKDDYCITDPRTEKLVYNCFAWSIGRIDKWLSGDEIARENTDRNQNQSSNAELSDFDVLYKKQWLEPVVGSARPANAVVALYADSSKNPTHAARKTGVACGGWESKMGGADRIAHFPEQLEGGEYGEIERYYVPMLFSPKPNQSTK